LKLGVNEKYREHILSASKISKIMPQAIATLINAEAGRVTETIVVSVTGKQKKGKNGKTEEQKTRKVTTDKWREDSTNPRSSARGLTQFLNGTWIGQARITSTHLHAEAIEREYVEKVIKQVVIKKAVAPKKAQHGKPAVAGREAVTKEEVSYVVKQEQKLLNMRIEPEFSIIASVEYGMQNLKTLSGSFKKIDNLNDSDKAKLFYLTHHLGVGDAIKFINNQIEEDDKPLLKKNGDPVLKRNGDPVMISGAQTLLEAQIGVDPAEKMASDEDGNYILAHRRWLISFINKTIKPKNFACNPDKIAEAQDLFNLILNLDGTHPVGFIMKK
jgi:hypothetical protein